MCDESWVLGVVDVCWCVFGFSLVYYLGVLVGLYMVWVVCIVFGVIIGLLLGDIYVYGFDMVFFVVFLVLLCGMW